MHDFAYRVPKESNQEAGRGMTPVLQLSSIRAVGMNRLCLSSVALLKSNVIPSKIARDFNLEMTQPRHDRGAFHRAARHAPVQKIRPRYAIRKGDKLEGNRMQFILAGRCYPENIRLKAATENDRGSGHGPDGKAFGGG
jgi:hypothetical protein